MRIIATRTLKRYCECYPEAAGALRAWKKHLESYNFKHFTTLKEIFGSADLISDDRVVFNIKGNHFRLVAAIDYDRQIAYVKWFGRHKDYNNINPAEVKHEYPPC